MAREFEFLFDVGSPAAWLAWARLPGLEARAGARARLVPVLLGGIFKATGNASPLAVPAKGRWLFEDLSMWAEAHGIPFRIGADFPVNTLTAMRAVAGLEGDARQRPLCDALFAAMFRDGRDLGDPAVLAEVAAPVLPADELAALVADQAVKDRLRASTEAAVARGVFGVPTMFVDGRMFFGQDRLDFVERALA